jgi:hypothetical protein
MFTGGQCGSTGRGSAAAGGAWCVRCGGFRRAARSVHSSASGCEQERRLPSRHCSRRSGRREVREGLVLQIADRQLNNGVLTCSASTTFNGSVRLVMHGKYPPVRPQLGLRSDEPCATDDKPPSVSGRLGYLSLPVLRVVLQGSPRRLGDPVDRLGNPELQANTDRIGPARGLQASDQLFVPERRVGPQELLASGASACDTRDQLIRETNDTARAARASLA